MIGVNGRHDLTGKRKSIKLSGRSRDQSERGASLILALVFIVVIAVIVGAISSLTLNDLNNTSAFDASSNTGSSASDVANLAIQSVRYVPQTANNTLSPCWSAPGGISEQQFNGVTIAIWCSSVLHAGSSQSRVVTMYACTLPLGSSGQSCKGNPLLTLVEAYDDYSAAGTDLCTPAKDGATYCGFGASTLVWTWGPLSAVGGLILNTISSPNSPASLKVGTQFTPSATTTSGDPITVTLQPNVTACTISQSGVVSFVAPGPCTLNLNDPGNFLYAPAAPYPETFQITP